MPDREAERPTLEQDIEITPAMVEAGVLAFLGFDSRDLDESEPKFIVSQILHAALRLIHQKGEEKGSAAF